MNKDRGLFFKKFIRKLWWYNAYWKMMSQMTESKVEIAVQETTLHIDIHTESLSGDNLILSALEALEMPEIPFKVVEINFRPVAYINSTGISEIINVYRRFKDASIGAFDLILINVSPRVNAILELVEINNIATVHLLS